MCVCVAFFVGLFVLYFWISCRKDIKVILDGWFRERVKWKKQIKRSSKILVIASGCIKTLAHV